MAGKLIGNCHIRTLTYSRSSPLCFSLPTSRILHESAYEKEVEDEVHVPANKPDQQEYWEPDPDTGVFVPASATEQINSDEPVVTCTTEETVLDEKAFFRPLEDLEPPPPESFTGEIPPVDPFAD